MYLKFSDWSMISCNHGCISPNTGVAQEMRVYAPPHTQYLSNSRAATNIEQRAHGKRFLGHASMCALASRWLTVREGKIPPPSGDFPSCFARQREMWRVPTPRGAPTENISTRFFESHRFGCVCPRSNWTKSDRNLFVGG